MKLLVERRDDDLGCFRGLWNAIVIAVIALLLVLAPYHLVFGCPDGPPAPPPVDTAHHCEWDQCR